MKINNSNLNFTSHQWKDFIIKRIGRSNGLTLCEVGVGEFSKCHIKSFIGSDNQLILVEALPKFNKEIQLNIQNQKNIIHHQIAVGDVTDFVNFNSCDIESHLEEIDSIAKIRRRSYSTIKIPCTTFDVLDPGNIDVLFIDIEGAEYYILKYLISRPKLIRLELNVPGFTNRFSEKIYDWIHSNNYEQTDIIGSDIVYIKRDI